MSTLFTFILHLDTKLQIIVTNYGVWAYAVLFLILFCETGLIVTPFLPGDSLLFAAGALSAGGTFNPFLLFFLLSAAAIIGDTVNYWIGHRIGPKIFHSASNRWLKREHLREAQKFYENHGGKTIILARFMPIVRTFAPFVAGVGRMSYRKFFLYNLVGGVAWVGLFVGGGYLFGNLPFVKTNFHIVILAIIGISFLPGVWHYMKQRRHPTRPHNTP